MEDGEEHQGDGAADIVIKRGALKWDKGHREGLRAKGSDEWGQRGHRSPSMSGKDGYVLV